MLKAELIDDTGKVIVVVRQSKEYEYAFGGIISIPSSWSLYDDSYGEEFFADFSIKWDGCSHFWYNGTNYPYDDELYPYYHECGLNSIYKYFIAKLFAWEVAKYYLRDKADLDDDLYIKVPKINVLEKYTVRYSEIDMENDWFYKNCIEKD
jgi:hypothetical protein